jgi:hypothetical protein
MSIFQINNSNIESCYYTLIGEEDFIDEDGYPRISSSESQLIVAKKTNNKKHKNINVTNNYFSFYLLLSPNNIIFNPTKLYSPIKNKTQFHFIDDICKGSWSFKEVSQYTFDKYLTFLRTKNLAWYKDAQRDLK